MGLSSSPLDEIRIYEKCFFLDFLVTCENLFLNIIMEEGYVEKDCIFMV